ncbi:MAG: hypothetical protein LBQ86_05180 [Holophagales bacterium]|jgi:hypothetical protein|nr:hypothetical protein [Holophagales bacterium]
MTPTALSITILLISTIAAILAGIAVFTNIAPEPPKEDPRINVIMEQIRDFEDEMKYTLEEIQKSLLLMERKIQKDAKEAQKGLLEHIDASIEVLLKAIHDLNPED